MPPRDSSLRSQGQRPANPPGGVKPSEVPTEPRLLSQAQIAPPPWAAQLLAGLENISSRVGLIESQAIRSSFSEAASDAGGVQLQTPATSGEGSGSTEPKVPIVPAVKKQPAIPMGESGSGYTRLPNGKLVKNKRPSHKPLNMRQASNWRSTATTMLVSYLKEVGIQKEDPKPVNDLAYATLVADLENSKEYYSYVKSGGTFEVQAWRVQAPQYTGEGLLSQIEESIGSEDLETVETGFEAMLLAQSASAPMAPPLDVKGKGKVNLPLVTDDSAQALTLPLLSQKKSSPKVGEDQLIQTEIPSAVIPKVAVLKPKT